VHILQKRQFHGILFIFIKSLYNYYQFLDVPSVVSCDEILWCENYECISNIFSLIGNIKILKLFELSIVSNIQYEGVLISP